MGTNFSAGPQALGYLYQLRYSLYSLLSDQRGDTVLYVEGLDDVVRTSSGNLTLEQLKHHIDPEKSISEHSVELWKTLRVWFTKFSEGDLKPEKSMLFLITTAEIKAESSLRFLRAGNDREVKRAHVSLSKIANELGNKSLLDSYKSFVNTCESDQERLLSSVFIVDNAPTIKEIEPKIKHRMIGVRNSVLDSVYERLEGWWFNKIVNHLNEGSKEGIQKYTVTEKIADINDQLKTDSLPIDFGAHQLTEEQFKNHMKQMFVRQLNAIKLSPTRINFAILDYYRAFEQRAKWVREALIVDDDLLGYKNRLIEGWGRQKAFLEDSLPQASDAEQLEFGKRLLEWMEQKADIPIRTNMPVGHSYVMRGSFHLLADANEPAIYWHPKFLEQLTTILNPIPS